MTAMESDKLIAIDHKVTNILMLLKGNDLDKDDKGMIGELKDHEERLSRIEKIVDRGFWFFVGLSLFAGWGLIDIISKVVLKK